MEVMRRGHHCTILSYYGANRVYLMKDDGCNDDIRGLDG